MGSIITLLHCGHKETATQQHSMQTYRNRKLDCCRCCGLLIIAGGLTEVAHIVRSVTVDSVHSWQVGGKGKGERVFPSMRTCSWWLLFKKEAIQTVRWCMRRCLFRSIEQSRTPVLFGKGMQRPFLADKEAYRNG